MFPASQIFAPFAPIPPITLPHSRLRRRARTSGSSVSGLPPTRSRRRPRRLAPPIPAALSPGSDPARRGPRPVAAPSPGQDRWQLRLQDHTRATTLLHVRTTPTPVGKVTTLLHVHTAPTPVGKVTTFCMSVRHRPPWAKAPLEFRTPPAENWGLCGFTTKSRAHGSLSGCGRAV